MTNEIEWFDSEVHLPVGDRAEVLAAFLHEDGTWSYHVIDYSYNRADQEESWDTPYFIGNPTLEFWAYLPDVPGPVAEAEEWG